MKITYLKRILASMLLLAAIGCDDGEDFTGESKKSATGASLSVSLDFPESQTLMEGDNSFGFTVSLSEPQIVNVSVNLIQTGGNATKGEDFDFPDHVVIPRGATSASGDITILSDDAPEGTETATILIGTGSEANVTSISSKTVSLSITNATGGDLDVGLEWAAAGTVTDNGGNEIDATDLADLVLQIQDANGMVVHEADGAGFEHVALEAADPDGEYFVVAKFFDASDIPADLNLTSTFDQAGIINHDTSEFPAAMNTAFVCDNNFYTLNKITKSGENYTIEAVGEPSAYPQGIAGTYSVVSSGESTDSGPVNNPLMNFASTVTIVDNGDRTYGLSDGWAGVYIDWYSIYGNTDPEPQTLAIDVCEGTLSASWTDIFGGSQTLKGTINADGTITMRLDNEYGDFADQVYTPQ